MSTHESATEHDDDGWLIPTCSCGWKFGAVPDDETATDCLMDHAYMEGVKEGRKGSRTKGAAHPQDGDPK